jgi:hypothetical protein
VVAVAVAANWGAESGRPMFLLLLLLLYFSVLFFFLRSLLFSDSFFVSA